MAECKETAEQLKEIEADNARLRGEVLASGVLLAQLLQSIAKSQLNPHAFVTRISSQAQEAVAGVKPPGTPDEQAAIKAAAVDTIKNYEEQIRSILPI